MQISNDFRKSTNLKMSVKRQTVKLLLIASPPTFAFVQLRLRASKSKSKSLNKSRLHVNLLPHLLPRLLKLLARPLHQDVPFLLLLLFLLPSFPPHLSIHPHLFQTMPCSTTFQTFLLKSRPLASKLP